MVELSVYNDIPHLLTSSCDQPTQGQSSPTKGCWWDGKSLWALLLKVGAARILLVLMPRLLSTIPSQEMKQVPPSHWLWSLSTSWQTLMMAASKEVEDAIIRLWQKAQQGSTWSLRPNGHWLMLFQVWSCQCTSQSRFCGITRPTHGPSLDENGQRNYSVVETCSLNRSTKIIRFARMILISDDDVERLWILSRNKQKRIWRCLWSRRSIRVDFDGGMGGLDGWSTLEEAKALVIETKSQCVNDPTSLIGWLLTGQPHSHGRLGSGRASSDQLKELSQERSCRPLHLSLNEEGMR